MGVVWLLVATAIRPDARDAAKLVTREGGDDLTLRGLKSIVYGDAPSVAAIHDLSAEGRLRRLQIIVRTDAAAGEQPEARATWAIAPRVLAWLLGDNLVASEVESLMRLATTNAVASSSFPELEKACSATNRTANNLVVVSGAPGLGRRTRLNALARSAGIELLEVDATKLAKDVPTLRKQASLIARECNLLDRVPCLLDVDALVDDKDQTRADIFGSELSREINGPMFVTCGITRPAMRWDRPTLVVDVKAPTSDVRAKLWSTELGQGTQEDHEYLATQYPLAPALIHRAAKTAKARANGRKMEPEDITAAVRAVLDDKLGDYAKRVEVTQTWDDLVLPHDQIEAVQYLIARISRRRTVYEQWGFAAKVGKGLGTSALFSGPPGTGKTMVAALIAKDLGLELYQVDMAKVVSKFIGETERNLAALFDAAEAGHAILLFDEADSLFGKRTEVKSSNDRYANLETNYMLQRLESFTGICLLTSNHESTSTRRSSVVCRCTCASNCPRQTSEPRCGGRCCRSRHRLSRTWT